MTCFNICIGDDLTIVCREVYLIPMDTENAHKIN